MSAAELIPFDPPEPSPLVPERAPPLAFPVNTLGPVLAGAVAFIVEATQCSPCTAAQSVLAVAGLAAQAHGDVTTPAGLTKPLSLFFVTIAASGERKSAADSYALAPVREVEAEGREDYRRDWSAWRNRHDAWEAERTKIKRTTKTDSEGKRAALDALGEEPLPPLHPARTVEDTTTEGLVKGWADSHGSLGLFTAEGAKVISGHAMSDESRMRTAATYSALWDEGRAERIRAGDGRQSLRGRRLAMHLMAQPGVAATLIGAADLQDQGLTGRLLVCEAPELAGVRLFREPPTREDPRFLGYEETMRCLLRLAPPTLDGRNELAPRAIGLTPDARQVWIALHDEIEPRLRTDGDLGRVKPFGNKLAEHAARMAGVLALVDDPSATVIDAETMHRVAELARFYATEAERLNEAGKVEAHLHDAEKLRRWLKNWPEPLISAPDVQRLGPSDLRTKQAGDRAFATLEDHGWLVAEGAGVIGGEKRRETFRIIRPRPRL